eukprot:128733_1
MAAFTTLVYFVSVIWCIFQTHGSQDNACSDPDSCRNSNTPGDSPVIQLSGCNTDCGRVELYNISSQKWNALCFETIANTTELAQNICGIVGFPKLNSINSYSPEHANLTAKDTCIDLSTKTDCFQSFQTLANCLQNNLFSTKPVLDSTDVLGLSCQAANDVKLQTDYFTPDTTPFSLNFMNLFDSATAKLDLNTDMSWLTVRSKDIERSYIYSTDFLAENGLSRDAED